MVVSSYIKFFIMDKFLTNLHQDNSNNLYKNHLEAYNPYHPNNKKVFLKLVQAVLNVNVNV